MVGTVTKRRGFDTADAGVYSAVGFASHLCSHIRPTINFPSLAFIADFWDVLGHVTGLLGAKASHG
jgi:hypothetical protein